MAENRESLDQILSRFDSISLCEMDKVKLMNRVDTKFLLGLDKLPIILQKAAEHYRIVEIDGLRTSPYSSIYFDTEDFKMYITHHNGKLNRFKIRCRSYLNSGDSFLEVKKKNNKRRTSKQRIRISEEKFSSVEFDDLEAEFIDIQSPYLLSGLKPSLQNFFHRITLVDKNETERVTIDVGLKFRKAGDEEYKEVEGLVIIEMKQDGAVKSHFRQYLTESSIIPESMSKYCLGMIMTYPGIKSNRFKKKLRLINKITHNNVTN